MYERFGRFEGSTQGQGQVQAQELDAQAELVRQREYLERNLSTIRDKLKKDSEIHRQENLRVLQDNTQLLQEINVLRRELKTARTRTHSLETTLGLKKRREKKLDEEVNLDPILIEKEKVIDLQMTEIRRLNSQLEVAKKEIEKRPQSGPKLPPMQT
jgi:chromosome segregation ATPase